jgi:Phosphoenolpyruvate carboxylase
MANWSIYKAKEELTAISKECGIDVVFFDGRGGPPARGGGKTHKFYASLGKNISSKEIQLTIQGQTVSSNFGTIDSAQFNLEQLIHAGISNGIFANKETNHDESRESIVQQLADISFDSYNQLKNHPDFVDYLVHASPLRFYSEQILEVALQNVEHLEVFIKKPSCNSFCWCMEPVETKCTGYFGVGTALQKLEQQGKLPAIKKLYNESLFFKTLLDNCEMAMIKSFFPLTAHLADHPKFGRYGK